MNLNIAFNTIIYILVFLLPGVLFRRAFFSGKFKTHFDSGNNIERFLWNIMLSFFCLTFFCSFISIISYFSVGDKFLFENNSQSLIDNFRLVYENKFPEILNNPESLFDVFYKICLLYLFSLVLGFLLHKFIFIFGLEKKYSFLKFQNNWDYITNSNRQNNINHTIGDLHFTKIDIKTIDNELFTGKLYEIIFDKDGKIEAVAMQEAYKFYRLNKESEVEKIEAIKNLISPDDAHIIFHSETISEYVYRKRVKGNIFTIFNNNITNLSITYVKISGLFEKFQSILKSLVSASIILITFFSLVYAIWDFGIFQFASTFKRLGFCILTPITFIYFILFFINFFDIKNLRNSRPEYFNNLKEYFLILIFFLSPYLYIFDIVGFGVFILLLVVCLFFIGIFSSQEKSES